MTVIWLFKRLNRQLIYAFDLFLMGVSSALTPLFPRLVYFLVNQAVFGFAAGGFDVASNVLILEMWSERSQPFIQTVHLFFGVAASVAPLISAPFVPSNKSKENNSTATVLQTIKSQIYIPYLITASIAILAGVIVVTHELLLPYRTPLRAIRRKNEHLLINPDTNHDESTPVHQNEIKKLPSAYYYTLITLSTFILAFYLTVEMNILSYTTLFVENLGLGITDETALQIVATFGIVFSVFRFCAIFLSLKLRPVIMLYISLIILFVSNLIMLVSGWTSVHLVWVTTGFLGAGCSWIYGAMYTFVEERIDVTNLIGGTFMCITSLATAVNPIIIGHFIKANPLIFAYVNFTDVVIVILLFAGLRSTDFWKKSLLNGNNVQSNNTPEQRI